jgi:hypothetical protein
MIKNLAAFFFAWGFSCALEVLFFSGDVASVSMYLRSGIIIAIVFLVVTKNTQSKR